MTKYIAPSVDKTGFNCPHCNVLTVQNWGYAYLQSNKQKELPSIWDQKRVENAKIEMENNPKYDEEKRRKFSLLFSRLSDKLPFLSKDQSEIYAKMICNLFVAECDHCNEISIWMYSNLIYPLTGEIQPHEDLPSTIKQTFNEASKIVEISPRASAALARLTVQEFCNELGCKSKKIDDQIGELVKNGLDQPTVKMLDVVRVIGNNAVHPGEINLKDDSGTAKFLLNCINRICQKMITEPKEVDEIYKTLPQGALEAIDRRNQKNLPKPDTSPPLAVTE